MLETGYKKYTYTQSDYNYSSSPTFSASTIKLTFFNLTFPVYINYSPAEWISIWGGMNYSYGYYNRVVDVLASSTNYTNASLSQFYSSKSNSDNSTYQSMKSTFLGVELKHPSGLRVQIAFDEDVASFRDWNMSVGYHF